MPALGISEGAEAVDAAGCVAGVVVAVGVEAVDAAGCVAGAVVD